MVNMTDSEQWHFLGLNIHSTDYIYIVCGSVYEPHMSIQIYTSKSNHICTAIDNRLYTEISP